MEIYKNLSLESLDGEIWKEIDGYNNDYMISNYGRVKSFKRYKEGKILTPQKDKAGYLIVSLYKNKKPHFKKVHRLVLENFDPRKDMDKLQGNHKNGIKNENIYPENIEWLTPSDNVRHAFEIGLMIPMKGENHPMFGKKRPEHSERMKGENHPQSILTEKDVIEIRIDLKEGKLTQKQIGEKFGVDQTTISDIKRGKTWKHHVS